jgi:serine/threonine-protein kinase
MHMPVVPPRADGASALGQQRPVSAPPPAQPPMGSQPPAHASHSAPPHAQSVPPQPQLPPVSRNMEATAVVPRAQQGSKAGLVVGLLLAVMAIAAAGVYMLMPRTATLVVNVADNKGAPVKALEVSVDDKQVCTSSPCIVPNVNAGVHSVKVSANGYEPLAPLAVTVEARKDLTKDFSLTPSKAVSGTGFKVAGNQPGVKLLVDGKDVGPLPQEMRDLEPGDHKLKFVGGDRYAPLEKTVSVAKDEIVDLGSVSLKVVKGKATIQLGTPGAKVYLVLGTNRKEVPQFPMGIEFDPNERWVLEATAPGMEEYKQPITWDDGQAEKTFTVTLTPKGQAPVAAAPTHATTPAAPAQPAAAPAKPAAAPASFLKGEQGGDTAKAETPKKETPAAATGEAFLNINSLPASTVVLDGKPLGPTPKLKVSVSPGSHTILFVNAEQSLKKSISVEVKAGETKAAFAKLRE